MGLTAIATFVAIAGCSIVLDTRHVHLHGEGSETPWWAAITTVTSSGSTSTATTARGVVVTTLAAPSDVLFEFGSTILTPTAGGALDGVASTLSDERVQSITVVGHTDHLGTGNDDRGRTRAQAVITYLTGHGVAASKFEPPATAGASDPLCREVRPDGSDDADCRAQDRRVTITYTTVEPGR